MFRNCFIAVFSRRFIVLYFTCIAIVLLNVINHGLFFTSHFNGFLTKKSESTEISNNIIPHNTDQPIHEPTTAKKKLILVMPQTATHLLNPGLGTHYTKECEFTVDPSLYNQSHAVLMYTNTLDFGKLPKHRPAKQLWVVNFMESPVWRGFRYGQHIVLNNLFNATMDYTRKTDIPKPYGILLGGPSEEYEEGGVETYNYAANKTEVAIWLVSHCSTKSKREVYVQELQKFLTVDIFGGCTTGQKHAAHTICANEHTKNNMSCFVELIKKYKFFLAFENAFCEDYVTEKAWRSLKERIVPVVLGGADYSAILPRNSFINALDFTSPAKLAAYLKILDGNDKRYNSYFEWRKSFHVGRDISMAKLCRYVQNHQHGHRVYKDMTSYWSTKKCLDPKEAYKGAADMVASSL